jgi:arylsulfatase A-like enzyme
VHTPYAPNADARAKLAPLRPADYRGSQPEVFQGLETTAFNFGQLALDETDLRYLSWLYDAEVWSLDQRVGELFSALAELGVLDSTLVVIFSDHGEEFGEHGSLAHGENLHQETMHVPLIFRAPGLVPVGVRVHTPAGLLDVPATIADLLGVGPILRNTPGRSHAAWMRLEPTPEPAPVYSELVRSATACGEMRDGGFGTCHEGGVALRDEDYTYVHSQAKRKEWLYDRRIDPTETVNLAETKPEIAAKYRRRVDAFRRSATKRGLPFADAQVDLATQSKLRALGYTK